MAIKIIKKTNNRIQFLDSGRFMFSVSPSSTVDIMPNDDGVQVTDSGGTVYDVVTELVGSTQVEPAGEVAFTGTTNDLALLLSESFFFPIDSGGGGGTEVIKPGATPPTDQTKLWDNTNDNLLYFYDAGDGVWITKEIFEVEFARQGRANNNTFLRYGNVNCDLQAGAPMGFNASLISGSYSSDSLIAGSYDIYSNASTNGGTAVFIGRVNTTNASNTGSDTISNLASGILENNFVSVRWQGQRVTEPKFILQYRKVYI